MAAAFLRALHLQTLPTYSWHAKCYAASIRIPLWEARVLNIAAVVFLVALHALHSLVKSQSSTFRAPPSPLRGSGRPDDQPARRPNGPMCCRFEILGTLILFYQDLKDRRSRKTCTHAGATGRLCHMLHEILLSLSGHPSPLLRPPGAPGANDDALGSSSVISPSERALLASLAHLSDLHVKLIRFATQIAASHPSVICRAVAAAIDSVHLAAFQGKVLDVEDTILRKDAGLVGAYNIVPLTAVVGEFVGWTRRMEWLWELAQFMLKSERSRDDSGSRKPCTGSMVIDRLRDELQTGYMDIEEVARSLVAVAEVAWLKQVSAWILYGKLPSFGADDFFVQRSGDGEEEYVCVNGLLPSFVTTPTAAAMLFIGKSLNQIRVKSADVPSLRGTDHLFTQLAQLAGLEHPLDSATFSRTIMDIRHFLSRTTLQRLLPPSKVLETLQLLRDFFLLRRGEFAMALTHQADEKIRGRWRRVGNLAYEKREGLGTVVIKEGEVAAVLARTWAAMGTMQGEHAEEDEGVELARDLLRLQLTKSRSPTPMTPAAAEGGLALIAPTPFRNLLFSAPVVLTLQIPSPLDLFLSQSDLQTYTAINSYLLSLRRAHIRLTDLWKLTSLRRHHPAPPAPPYGSTRGGREKVLLFRQRHALRSNILRNAWATASAAIFFLGETEGYLQTEVVAGLTEGFHQWLAIRQDSPRQDGTPSKPMPKSGRLLSVTSRRNDTNHDEALAGDAAGGRERNRDGDGDGKDDIWLAATASTSSDTGISNDGDEDKNGTPHRHPHDPQTLATAHRRYLCALIRRLLLTHQSFTDPLYELLVQIDHLVALVHRLHSVWTAADLEADVGVVDAFVDLAREERDVQSEIRGVEGRVKRGIEGLVAELRRLEAGGAAVWFGGEDGVVDEQGQDEAERELSLWEAGQYVPRRVGGVDRLLMKLDFGSWFGTEGRAEGTDDDD